MAAADGSGATAEVEGATGAGAAAGAGAPTGTTGLLPVAREPATFADRSDRETTTASASRCAGPDASRRGRAVAGRTASGRTVADGRAACGSPACGCTAEAVVADGTVGEVADGTVGEVADGPAAGENAADAATSCAVSPWPPAGEPDDRSLRLRRSLPAGLPALVAGSGAASDLRPRPLRPATLSAPATRSAPAGRSAMTAVSGPSVMSAAGRLSTWLAAPTSATAADCLRRPPRRLSCSGAASAAALPAAASEATLAEPARTLRLDASVSVDLASTSGAPSALTGSAMPGASRPPAVSRCDAGRHRLGRWGLTGSGTTVSAGSADTAAAEARPTEGAPS